MKKILAILMFLFISLIASAIDYHVKTGGDDLANGDMNNPWATINKVNTFWAAGSFVPGDRILFNRGDIFYGTITVSESGADGNPITIGAYGTGADPVITGFTTITSGWTDEGSGIYSKNISCESSPNMVTVNGVNTPIGRWPNTGYLSIDACVGTTSITDADLLSSPDWDGAEVVIRKNHWIIDRNIITNHAGNTITYTSASSYPGIIGYGYFIQNDLETLDSIGEWYYNSGTSKFYMYFGANDPNNYIVKVSALNENINILSKDYITINNVAFEGANHSGIYITSSSNISIQECNISFSGNYAINARDGGACSNILIVNNTITDTQNNAIEFYNTVSNSTISGNVVTNTGIYSGMGVSADGQNIAIGAFGDYNIIEYNKVINTGYIPIAFGGSYSEANNNFVDNYGYVKDDVGAIYTASFDFPPVEEGRKIQDNICINGIGANEGTADTAVDYVQGIYLDQHGKDILVQGNTVYNVGVGIFLHNSHEIDILDNTIYGVRWAGIMSRHDSYADDDPARNVNIQRNKIIIKDDISPDRGYPVTAIWLFSYDGDADILQFGTADSNYYTHPVDETVNTEITITEARYFDPVPRSLAAWKICTGQDINSNMSPISLTDSSLIDFYYNSNDSDIVIFLPIPMIDVTGEKYASSITLHPFTSAVLMPDPNPTTGIIETSVASFYIFPNPSADKIELAFDGNDFEIQIIDVLGQILISEKSKKTLNIQSLTPGTYIIRLTIGDAVSQNKIVVY